MKLGQVKPEQLCPVGCGRNVLPGSLMCSGCWFSVPRSERSEVNRTWRLYVRDKHDVDRVMPRIREYRVAREKAIASALAARAKVTGGAPAAGAQQEAQR